MKGRKTSETGFVLVMTLCFTVIAAIGVAAFLHLTKTQIVQVRLQSHSTKAFYTAEVGLEKAMKLLKDDFYYTPEEMEPSWADDKVYSADGYIHLQTQKYLNPRNPHYDDEFYPLVAETDYNLEGNGGYKSTYTIDISNLAGWTDRIWVKATGRYYRRNEAGAGFVLEVERRILALLRARDISPWNNAIFAGVGQEGRVINGNVDIRGSVHLLGTALTSDDLAMELSGAGNVGNNYVNIPAELGTRIPSVQKVYKREMVESLEAEVRVQHGKVALSGTATLGKADVPGNDMKETAEGAYITDGYAGNMGERSVYSDNGTGSPYDLDEFSIRFPRLSERYGEYDSYLDYLRDNALVISHQQKLNELRNVTPGSSFSYSNANGEISMDGNGHLRIEGIVVVEGDVNFNKSGNEKMIEYDGKGVLCSAKSVGVNCNLITRSLSTYPTVDLLGVMAADAVTFNSAQINVMGVFYGENRIVSQKQTSVTGTFFSNYFDMGQNVPSIFQVPETVRNLPDGMIGDFRVWSVKRMTWAEIGPGGRLQAPEA